LNKLSIKSADLYVRVSTDDQAKGYSPAAQEELLRKYCTLNNITIRRLMKEDHSAKTFNRPEWKKYLVDLKRNKNQVDAVLFLKWDRFSRNAGDAYQMINTLRKLGVEPQAIEQPLDLSIPENKMMLAFYLAAPEVENDRRALNVFYGMRRAKKEGRYVATAPYGYINKADESGKIKFIAPLEQEADIVRWSFNKLSEGILNTEQVYREARSIGFNGTKSLFWFVIRNPVYCGKILVPKFQDEEAQLVAGKHEPLISESLFNKVQDVLDGRKRGQYALKVVSDVSLPLRGFVLCPICSKQLTGSASKGRSKHYAYYHCYGGCSCRFKAEVVNEAFEAELERFSPRTEYSEAFKTLLLEAWQDQNGNAQAERKSIRLQLKDLEDKLSYTRELLASQKIEVEDFKAMKAGYTAQIERLEARLSDVKSDDLDIDSLLTESIQKLLGLSEIYRRGSIERKREVIGSMFPEKLSFDGSVVRTARVNEVAAHIYQITKSLEGKKKRTSLKNSDLSSVVGVARFELTTSWSQTKRDTGLRYTPKLPQ
jgi:site-specific DNA recombinase